MAPSPDAPDAGAAGRESEAGVPVAAAALERLRALLKRLQQVDPRQPLDSLLEELAGMVQQETAGDGAALIVRRDDRGTEVGVIAAAPPHELYRYQKAWTDAAAQFAAPPLGAAEAGALFLSVGETGYPPLLTHYARAGLRVGTSLSAPLLRRGLHFGFIEVINPRHADWRSPVGLSLFETLADEVGVLLDNALLLDRLRRERLENELLYSVSQKISLSVESTEVLNSIIDSLNMVVPYDAAAIFLLDTRTLDVAEETMRGYPPGSEGSLQLKLGEGIVGWAAKTGQSVIVPDVRTDPRYVRARPETRAEMVAPLKTGGEVIGVFNLESDRVNAYTPHELRLLETFANHAAVGIERSRLLRQQLEKERLDRELKFARRIQLSFLPERDPDWTGYDVSAANISSEEVSGDFYDFIPISRDNWGVVIADVSGKGVPAALIMASLRAALWAEVRNTYALATICARMNNFLYQSLGDYEFVTAVYGVLDLDSHIFTYTNAGHLPPLHVRPDGEVSFLEEGGLILGAFRDAEYAEGRGSLAPGELLVFYTDGAVEAMNAAGDEFGRDRLVEVVLETRNQSARAIREEIVARVLSFSGQNRPADDLTLIILKRDAAGPPKVSRKKLSS